MYMELMYRTVVYSNRLLTLLHITQWCESSVTVLVQVVIEADRMFTDDNVRLLREVFTDEFHGLLLRNFNVLFIFATLKMLICSISMYRRFSVCARGGKCAGVFRARVAKKRIL